ncbi:DNA polymerase III subunit gamma/tau [Faecalicoccus acidiformans]|uniref:DNA polymerase III subunit gamma/tau n=1 Tax=Faecalicoccus acidiformans TaxID=915173 RepID=UPI0025A3D4F4|nr:DNA polymerase III subunit gamma/tau [Faecalicoccus acidiformans]MDM8203784.1 DNA polymerase III subunit gamma/tau [Faecalicoccus acidiformans]
MYQALYRKYRPQTFDEVVGQKHIIQTLKNAIVQDRIAHAYLFCGPRGTGKTSIAKIFAKMLNCEDKEHAPCGECLNCQMVQNGSHPDIIEIDAASNNGVDEVRDLIDRVKYAPMQGTYKIYIIDEVHMMTTGAFNALLKTIEEPPAHVVFILATTEPNKVIPTIISRCQRFDFNKVSLQDLISRLQIVCRSEKIDIDEEAVYLIAQLSDGGMRDALSILDQCTAFCTSNISIDDVRQIYGVMTTAELGTLFYDLYKGNTEALIRTLNDAEASGMDLKRLTQDMISLLKDSLILDRAPQTGLVLPAHKEVIQEKFMISPSPFRLNVLNELMDTYTKFHYASSILDYLETAFLKCVLNSDIPKESKIEQKVENKSKENGISEPKITDSSYDLSSDYSEIDKKEENNAENTTKIDDLKISDVSRETLKQDRNEDRKIRLEEEYVLQLLVGAQKKERQIDTQKMSQNEYYLSDLKFGRFASTLRNAHIVASGKNYMIVGVNSEIEAKEINSLQLEEGYESFTESILGVTKVVFALDSKQEQKVLEDFKIRWAEKTLPEAAEVQIVRKSKVSSPQNTKEEQIKELFPTLEIVED